MILSTERIIFFPFQTNLITILSFSDLQGWASTQIMSTSTLLSMSTSTEKMYKYFSLSTSTSTSYPKY